MESVIASTDLDKANILYNYFSLIFTEEDNTNIPSGDPIENALQMMDIVVTEEDVLNKLLV